MKAMSSRKVLEGQAWQRLVLALLIAIAGLAALTLIDAYYRGQIQQANSKVLQEVMGDAQSELIQNITATISITEDLQAFMLASPSLPDFETFDRFSALMLDRHPQALAMQYVDPDLIIRHIYPLEGNEEALNLDLATRPAAPFAEKAIQEKRMTVSNPTITVQGTLSVFPRAPLYRRNELLGLVQVVVEINPLLEQATENLDERFQLQLQDATGTIFWGPDILNGETESTEIAVGDNFWTLTIGWRSVPPAPEPFVLMLIWGGGGLLLLSLLILSNQIWTRTEWLRQTVTKRTELLELEISEHKQAEEQLRFQAKLLNVIGQAVIVTDPEGTVTWINRATEDLYGWSAKEAVGRDILNVTVPQMSRKQAEDIIAQLSKGKSWSGEFLVQHRDGTIFPAQIDNSVIRDDEGRVTGIIGISSDITERKQAEETIQQYAEDLERRVQERTIELTHANRTKDEFLATMSHELRTPLNSILGFSETLLEQRRGPLNKKQEEYVSIIQSSGQHLLGLINDILEVSKIEAGKLDLRPNIISVKDVCESSLNFVKEMAARKSISVGFKNESSIASLRADPQRLKQILVNLLSNAVKFTPEKGKVSLEVRTNDEKDQILFSVIDNGIGIAHEHLSKLFIPFSQIDSSLSRLHEGTGLGLALVLKLTEMHGGSVNVESELNKGSCFTVILPWNVAQSIKDKEDQASLTPVAVIDEPASDIGEHTTILLAEDYPANVLTIQEYLSDHGFEVLVAHNGIEAVKMAEESSPHIILMDIQMPVMDGLEAIRRLRANPRFASTPIIALTALAMPGDRERCLEAGANEYLSKPVSLKALVKTICELVAQ